MSSILLCLLLEIANRPACQFGDITVHSRTTFSIKGYPWFGAGVVRDDRLIEIGWVKDGELFRSIYAPFGDQWIGHYGKADVCEIDEHGCICGIISQETLTIRRK